MRALRPGLVLLAAVEVVLGLWTLLFPASFYAEVPTVDATPPFSEHLFRDFGGASLGLAVVLTAAAVWTERRLVVVAWSPTWRSPFRTWDSISDICTA